MENIVREDTVQNGENVLSSDAHGLGRHRQCRRCDVLPSKLVNRGADDDADLSQKQSHRVSITSMSKERSRTH